MLTRLAAITTIAAFVVAVIAYLWPRSPSEAGAAQQTPVIQSIDHPTGTTTQIGTATGPVTIINNPPAQTAAPSQPSPPRQGVVSGPVDIAGDWNAPKAKALALAKLKSYKWRGSGTGLEDPVDHTDIGQYSLLYRTREGIVLAFASITRGSECHACAPHLSFFEFEKRSGGWKLTGSFIAVTQAGSWGKAPTVGVTAVADDRFGVLLESGYMAQGWITSATSLYVRMGDTFRKVLGLVVGQASPTGQSWESTLTFRPNLTGLYDVEINRKGYPKLLDGDAVALSDVADPSGTIRPRDTFKFDGQAYRRSELVR